MIYLVDGQLRGRSVIEDEVTLELPCLQRNLACLVGQLLHHTRCTVSGKDRS